MSVMSQEAGRVKFSSKWFNILWVLVVLCLLWWVAEGYCIGESLRLDGLILITTCGFVGNALLKEEYRLTLFLALGVLSSFYFFSWTDALLLIGWSVALVGILHLPLALFIRIGILFLIGILFAAMKAGYITDYIPSNVITVIASLYMFRVIVYVYELRHKKVPIGWSERLAYFFMFPNILIALFPVVDLKTFRNTYYQGSESEIYLSGMNLICRGIMHLLLYRIIYLYAIPAVHEVESVWALLQYVVMSYTLILRLSGTFHIAVGILRLFGFNLPEIFNNYFLANGFSDYWRRINIYWKDFLLKIFFYPVFFKLRWVSLFGD